MSDEDYVVTVLAENGRLRNALAELTEHYVRMINSGDCGFWNPEGEPVIKVARAALEE